jgi:hypothetical protein
VPTAPPNVRTFQNIDGQTWLMNTKTKVIAFSIDEMTRNEAIAKKAKRKSYLVKGIKGTKIALGLTAAVLKGVNGVENAMGNNSNNNSDGGDSWFDFGSGGGGGGSANGGWFAADFPAAPSVPPPSVNYNVLQSAAADGVQ